MDGIGNRYSFRRFIELVCSLIEASQSKERASPQSAPVIVISHGTAENRDTYAYLAQHLASYGFAVAVPEHLGVNSQRFQEYFSGLAGAPDPMESVNQPLDIKYVLDELQRLEQTDPSLQGRLNLQQVGLMGHSIGGYTVLTLAGARIDFKKLQKNCNDSNNFFDLSLLVQCKTTSLTPTNYPLYDERVKAVLAVNPLAGTILGRGGLNRIKVPLMMLGSSDDIFTPVVQEQIRPFTWLKTQDKYLVLLKKGTHFSTLGESSLDRGVFPIPPSFIGPDPAIGRQYLDALAVAFFQTHVAQREQYRSYLNPSYTRYISRAPLDLILVQSFTANQLAELLKGTTLKSDIPSTNAN
jgi:predicted dienelactone hydrolase